MDFFSLIEKFDNTRSLKTETETEIDAETKTKTKTKADTEREVMLDDKLDSLKSINGYKGAAIADYTGEILVSDTGSIKGDLAMSAATFNDIFRSAHKASKDLDLGLTETMQILTSDGIVMMACSGEDARVHIHVFAIFEKDGNQALAKMALKKLVPQIVDELA